MHGGVAAIFGIMAISLINIHNEKKIQAFCIAFMTTALIHCFFNQFLLSPLLSTIIIFSVVPLSLIFIFQTNEQSLRKWISTELDSEIELLMMINEGKFSESKPGKYLLSIKERFSQLVFLDMLCLIRIYIELSVRAKSILMLKESGFSIENDVDIKGKLMEYESLKKNIGKTGMLALAPLIDRNRMSKWQLEMLNAK